MSKHLLYRKDLPNRTLTCSFQFVLIQLIAYLIVLIPAVSPAEAAGPLSFQTTKPRYFVDSTGKSVYLTGSYLDEYNMLSVSSDFPSHLDFLQQQKQNFTRVWGWEQSPWIYDGTGQITFSNQPYERTGPGLALDGALKFDLTRFNQAYFDQLRSRVVEAARRGIYVSVGLFEGFSTQKKIGRVNPWLGDPFQQANNINGISSDPNRNGSGKEFFSLAFPSLLTLQETFVRKVVDTLNDLDNVLYEVSGNGLAGSLSWQYRMIDYIKRYQAKKANQHPVGISDFYPGATAEVFNSSADWVVIPETTLNSPLATSNKVLVMEGTPVISGDQLLSTSPISLLQLLPEGVTSTQSPSISNTLPASNGVTPSSSSATLSTLSTTSSSANSQQSKVATPTITPNGGIYSGRVSVTLQTTTPGASIYYTTDGQSPTQSSRPYTGKFPLSDSTLVKAKAFKSSFEPSSEASAWFANAAVIEPSLVAHWKFDEGTGTTASDSSGNGNTGTLINGQQWTAGKIAGALSFDGVDDHVSFASQAQGTLAISAWVYAQAASGNLLPRIIDMPGYVLYLAAPAASASNPMSLGFISRRSTQDGKWTTPGNSLAYDTWNHVAVVYNSSSSLNNPDLYINGVKQTFSTITSPQGTQTLNGGTGIIGNRIPLDQGWRGIIDDLRVYDRALSATEIQTLYQQAAPSQTVATPVISPDGGNYSGPVSITMQTATSSASIYYTTDGSTPTQSSTPYTGAMTLTSSTTVKAKAFKNGYDPSTDASASFKVNKPFSFSLANSGDKSVTAGSSVTNSISTTLSSGASQSVSFSVSGLPAGATGSFSSASCSPTCASTMTINTTASTPAGSSTITVTATGGGITKTTTFSLTTSLPTVATPTISPNGGSYASSVSVTMQTATSGASIYYTTNGSTPTQSSTLYTGALTLTSSATVKAKAFKNGYNSSAEASALFTFTQPFSFSLANSGNKSVTAGSSVTNSISTTLSSGTSQAVTFSVSGLPAGATGSFSSASCSPACSTVLNINTTGSTPVGNFPITVSATGGGMSKTTMFTLTVTVALVATTPILNVSPTAVAAGNMVTATWSGIATPTTTDWIGLYLPGAADTSFINWIYVSCSTTAGSARASGSCSYLLPTTLSAGNYELRLFANDGFTPLATSKSLSVTLPVAPVVTTPILNVSPTAVAAGGMVTDTWSGIVAPSSLDWVGLYAPSTADTTFISWMYVSCTKTASTALASGSCSYTLPTTLAAGNYELRLFSNDSYTRLATSNNFSVTSLTATSPSPSFSSPTTTTGNVYYVATNGSDANSCTAARNVSTPKRTITAAAPCLVPGDTLYIRAGTYQGAINNIPSGQSWSAPVTLAAYPGETVTVRRIENLFPYVIIDGLIVDADPTLGTVGIQMQGSHHIRIKNTEIKNGSHHGILGGDDSEFINLHVHHNGLTCTQQCHGIYMGGNNNVIDGGSYHNNQSYGIHMYNASGQPSNNIVRNVLVYNNGSTGIGIVYGFNNRVYNNIIYGNGLGVWVLTTDGQIYNNTVYNNSNGGISVGYPRNTISNNIIYGNNGSGLGIYQHNGPVSGVVVKNNLAAKNGQNFGDSSGGGVTTQNNLFSDAYDPKFISLSGLNFRLQSGSPAIDAGIAVPEVLNDFAGTTRPLGRAYDIGAYEQ